MGGGVDIIKRATLLESFKNDLQLAFQISEEKLTEVGLKRKIYLNNDGSKDLYISDLNNSENVHFQGKIGKDHIFLRDGLTGKPIYQ